MPALQQQPFTATVAPVRVGGSTGKPGQKPNNRQQRPTNMSMARGAPAQNAIGAAPAPAPTPAPANPGTGVYSQYGSPFDIMGMLFGNQAQTGGTAAPAPSSGGGGSTGGYGMAGQSPWSYLGTGAVQTSNNVAPGYWHGGGTSPALAGQMGTWQNNQTLNHLANNRGGQFAMSDYSGGGGGSGYGSTTESPQSAMARAFGILGTGAIQSSNPVAPGYWHGAANSPAQAGAIGNWQNAMALQHLSNYRGPQMATSDYGGGFAMPSAAPAAGGAAPAPASRGGGTPAAGGASGGGGTGAGGIAPIFSTIQGNNPIYDSGQTQRNINQQVEQVRTRGSMRGNTKRNARPGMSLDAGSEAAATPAVGAAQADAAGLQASGGLMDELANQTYMLSGQEARGSEVLQMAELLRRLQQTGDYRDSAYTSSVMGPIIQQLMSSL